MNRIKDGLKLKAYPLGRLALILLSITFSGLSAQTTYYSQANGNWNSIATWSTVGFGIPINLGTYPQAGDVALIGGVGYSITVNVNITCAAVSVGNGSSLTIPGVTFTVTGNTTVGGGLTGSLNITGNAGTKTFGGLVTINSGGTWNNSTEGVTFRGGITNNGTFNAGTGMQLFDTNSQMLTGNYTIPFIRVTGVGLVNTNSLTVNTALSGTGALSQGSNAVLNVGGTSNISFITATASGNTVNFTGGTQTVNNNAYVNLGLSGSGVKTLQSGTTSIAGNLTLSGTVSTVAVTALAIGGSVTIGSGTAFTAGAFTHNIGGDWTKDGTFTHGGGTINFNGSGQTIVGTSTTFNNVILGGGTSTKIFSVATIIVSNLTINSGVKADLGTITTHTANALFLGGAVQGAGTWGSTSSTAAHKNDTYFSNTGIITISTGAFTYYSRVDGDWDDSNTWSTEDHSSSTNSGTFPVAGDFVVIGGGFTVMVSADATCTSLSFATGTSITNTLTVNSGNTLTVSGSVILPRISTSGSNTLNVGPGMLNVGSLSFTNGSSGTGHQVLISTGTATVSGSVSGTGASSRITFSGGGLLQLGGTIFNSSNGTLITVSGSTVEYNGSSQTVQALAYNNLLFSGSGTKTLAASTTVGGNLTIGNNTNFAIGPVGLTVTGTTTIGGGSSGTLTITANGGTKTFNGLVTVNSGGTWDSSGGGATFHGGITNNGTFTAGSGMLLFDTNSQMLTGNIVVPNLRVTGVILTSSNSLTVNTALSGTGALSQGSNAVLNIGATSNITTIIATASGNTVNFTGGTQTVNNNAYVNLGLSGSGVKTLQSGTTSIAGNLTLSGTVSTVAVTALAIGGSVTIGSGTAFTAGAFTHNIGGDWTKDGTFTHGGGTINFNGSGQTIVGTSTTFNNVILGGGTSTKIFSVATIIVSNLTINSGVKADLGTITTHTANALFLGGAVQGAGTWGSTSSTAAHKNDTYFSNTGIITISTGAFTYYSRVDGDWDDSNTWSTEDHSSSTNSGTFPVAGDFVVIGGGFTVMVSADATCTSLSFATGTSITNTLTVNSGNTLTVSGSVILPRISTSGSNTLNVGPGMLNVGSLSFTNGSSGTGHQVLISTGTATVSGSVSGTGASSRITFSGGGLLQLGGTIFNSSNGTLITVSGSTVEYNGSSQTVQALAYNNLLFSGSGTKTLAASTTVGGNLTIGNNTNFAIGPVGLTVTGTTTIGGGSSGTLTITANGGTKTFNGLVTVNSGGTWDSSGGGATFHGGITNNGTFTAGSGMLLFDTNSQMLTGTFVIPNLRISGVALTNPTSLTVNTALSGTGVLNQGTNAVLNIGNTSNITILIASASGNLVNFTGNNQTINSNDYYHLNLSGNGVNILHTGTTTIAGDFTLSGTVSTTGVTGITIGGSVNIGSGTSFTAGAFTHNVGGNWTNNGTFTHNNGTINFNGTTQSISGATTFNNLTVSPTTTLAISSGTSSVLGTLTLNAGSLDNTTSLLSLASGSNLIRNANGQLLGSAPSGGPYNLTFNGTTYSSGPEATGSLNNVTNNLAGSLTLTNSISLEGSLINNGVLASLTQDVTFSGTGAQTINGNAITFSNLNLTNVSGSLSLLSAHNMSGVLSLVNSSTFNAGSNLLTLLSTSQNQTASIASLDNSVTFNGTVVVQRFVPAADNIDRFISSPVSNGTVSQIQNASPVGSFPINGNFAGASFPCTGCDNDNANMWWYQESIAGPQTPNGYQKFPLSSNGDMLVPGVGYDVYMWNGVANSTISYSGNINRGNLSLGIIPSLNSITHTNNGNSAADGWNLVGNPYPSSVLWSTTGWSRTNIDPTIWVWDVVGQVWLSSNINNPGLGTLPNGRIALGQAFWVYAPAIGNATLTINENAKSSSSANYYREKSGGPSLSVSLLKDGVKESSFVTFSDAANDRYNSQFDFPKIELGIERMHLTLVKENMNLGYYSVTPGFEHDIPIRIVANTDGEYELEIESIGTFIDLDKCFLVDLKTNETINIQTPFKYSFNYLVNDVEKRFKISRKDNSENSQLVQVFPNSTTGDLYISTNGNNKVFDIRLTNMAGMQMGNPDQEKLELNKLKLNLSDYPSGVYLVKIITESGVVVKRIIKY